MKMKTMTPDSTVFYYYYGGDDDVADGTCGTVVVVATCTGRNMGRVMLVCRWTIDMSHSVLTLMAYGVWTAVVAMHMQWPCLMADSYSTVAAYHSSLCNYDMLEDDADCDNRGTCCSLGCCCCY
jgi:hypothetical protein